MLENLQLKNVVIAKQLDVDFESGLTVITGETGAGKSLVINALKLLLGARAQTHWAQAGEQQATISASFGVAALPEARCWLQDHGFDEEDRCVIRRIMLQDGRTKAYINGHAATLSDLKNLGAHLISIHGQHDGQQLLQTAYQRTLLDAYGHAEALALTVSQQFAALNAAKKAQDVLLRRARESNARAEFLRFQIAEFSSLDVRPETIEALDDAQKTLVHSEDILYHANLVSTLLQGESGVFEQLHKIRQSLQKIPREEKTAWLEGLTGAEIQCQEIAHDLQHLMDRLDICPERLQEIESQLTRLHDLARKHRTTPSQLAALLDTLTQELASFEDCDSQLASLEKTIQETEAAYFASAKQLSVCRQKAAKKLQQSITASIQTLGMPKGRFEILLPALTAPTAQGLEQVMFQVHLNPGQPPGALAKVASGGELSRISLAIHVATSAVKQTPTLIFDEVDAGISGQVALSVGRLLKTLATDTQIITITHLAQVAAQGSQHFHVSKMVTATETTSDMCLLEAAHRVNAIADLLSGEQHGEAAQALAKSLLANTAAV